MNVEGMLSQTATITPRTPAAEPDEYGNEVLEDGTPFTKPCLLLQTERTESGGDLNTEAETLDLYLSGAVAVDSRCKIEVDGTPFEVVGPPWQAHNPFSSQAVDFTAATVRRVA